MGVPVSGRRSADDGGGVGEILRVAPAGGFDAGELVVNFVPGIEIHDTGFRQAEPALGGDDGVAVAMMLALLKVARIHNGDKMDSFIDLAGYAACASEIVGKEAP